MTKTCYPVIDYSICNECIATAVALMEVTHNEHKK